jgi:transposase
VPIFGISREIFYRWKRAFEREGVEALINSKTLSSESLHQSSCRYRREDPSSEEYLERYHGMKVSSRGIYGGLKRHGLKRLPKNAEKHTVITHRYEKQVPGHHI